MADVKADTMSRLSTAMRDSKWPESNSDSDSEDEHSEDELFVKLRTGRSSLSPSQLSDLTASSSSSLTNSVNTTVYCEFCGDQAQSITQCQICLSTKYCSVACLRLDFSSHRTRCIPFRVPVESSDEESSDEEETFNDDEEEKEEKINAKVSKMMLSGKASMRLKKNGSLKATESHTQPSGKVRGTITTETVVDAPKVPSPGNPGAQAVPLATPMDDKGVAVLTEKEKERLEELAARMKLIESSQHRKIEELELQMKSLQQIQINSNSPSASTDANAKESAEGQSSLWERVKSELDDLRDRFERSTSFYSVDSLEGRPTCGLGQKSYSVNDSMDGLERTSSNNTSYGLQRSYSLQANDSFSSRPTALFPSMSQFFPTLSTPAEAPRLLVKDDPAYAKYFRLQSFGMPADHVKLKMQQDGMNPDLLDTPDAISPNAQEEKEVDLYGSPSINRDNYVPRTSGLSAPTAHPFSGMDPNAVINHLYSMVMEHHHLISSGSSTTGAGSTATGAAPALLSNHVFNEAGSDIGSTASVPTHKMPEQDLMAMELAQAEAEMKQIFGDEDGTGAAADNSGAAGKSLVQQLEQRARREQNQRIVNNRERIIECLSQITSKEFDTDVSVAQFVGPMLAELETFGLGLGASYQDIWSPRLVMRNKATGDFYFSSEERALAGKAYRRMWSMATLEQYLSQLKGKEEQLRIAPMVMKDLSRDRGTIVDKYLLLLKEAFRTHHKILKGSEFTTEVERMGQQKLPYNFIERGNELIHAGAVLGNSAMDLVEEEIRIMEKTVRGRFLRSHTVINVFLKTAHLLSVIRKMNIQGIDWDRYAQIETKVNEVKSSHESLSSAVGEEEEADML